jgi:hypothetical protein
MTAMEVSQLIGRYKEVAVEAMLFTNLDTIQATHRDRTGLCSQYWCVKAVRTDIIQNGPFASHIVEVNCCLQEGTGKTDRLQIVTRRNHQSDLPREFAPLISKHRLREPIRTYLAANLGTQSAAKTHKLFVMLPLPVTIPLPVHLGASFILAEDRRSIRFDGNGELNLESRYNKWLMSALIPELYTHFLELLFRNHDGMEGVEWWKQWPTPQPHPITSTLVDSFYACNLVKSGQRVSPGENSDALTLRNAVLDTELNPSLSGQSVSPVQYFIKSKISDVSLREHVLLSDQVWIAAFWAQFQHLKLCLDLDDVKNFPLVQTQQGDVYVSIAKCIGGDVFLAPRDSEEWLLTALVRMGCIVVHLKDCPAPVAEELLKCVVESRSIFHNVLLYFSKFLPESISGRFCALDASEHSRFADWARTSDIPEELHPTARILPIWPVLEPGTTFISAVNATSKMLPSSIFSESLFEFMANRSERVRYCLALERLGVSPMSYRAFRDNLRLPTDLQSEQDISRYRSLLRILIGHHEDDPRDVLVPCTTGVMVKSSTLYGRSEIFLQAFATRPQCIIHPGFEVLESGLAQFGLRDQINFRSFEDCARAVHEDTLGPDRVARSAALFQCYSETLPIQVLPLARRAIYWTADWHRLDSLRFIPRDNERRRSATFSQSSTYCKHLPEVVAPSEVVRADLEGIAWTQRALSLMPSGDILPLAYPQYGVPSVEEVVGPFFRHSQLLLKYVED